MRRIRLTYNCMGIKMHTDMIESRLNLYSQRLNTKITFIRGLGKELVTNKQLLIHIQHHSPEGA